MAFKKKPANKIAKPKVAKTVKMVRPDGKSADVHPTEVENYRSGGYEKA
jgi:hypothetical protein